MHQNTAFKREKKHPLTHPINAIYKKLDDCKSPLSRRGNVRYIGLSVYEKKEKKDEPYTVRHSAQLYANDAVSFKTSYDDFNGYAFYHPIQGDEDGVEIANKDFGYLRLFLPDIEIFEGYHNEFYLFDLNNNLYFQAIILFRTKSDKKECEIIQNLLKKILKIFKNKNCFLDTSILLPATRTIEKASLVIIDLIRNKERKNDARLKYADASITRKLIFDIAKIVVKYGFFIAGHTGDGFFFIYEKYDGKKLIYERTRAMMNEIEMYLETTISFFRPLNGGILTFKLRILIDEVDTIFEMSDLWHISQKLYFSPDLDKKFDNMKDTPKHNNKHLLIVGEYYDKFGWSSKDFEVNRSRKC